MLSTSFSFRDESKPLLATAIHNGDQMPAELLDICGITQEERFREEDPYTSEFAELFPNHTVVHTSRFAIDLNRSPEKAVYLTPEDCWGLPVRSAPVPAELLARLNQDYAAWYQLLRYQIDRLLQSHPFLVVLDLHSFNHRRGGADAEPDPQAQNPDIIIGRSNLQERYYPAAQSLCHMLNGAPYLGKPLDCRLDVKFTGGYLSRWLNHHYSDRLICLAIEFKKTFMDEWSGKLDLHAMRDLKALFHSAVRDWLISTYAITL